MKARITTPWSLTVLLPALLLTAAPAVADDRGLATDGAHHVVVTSFPTVGLEVGMPRRGWYARGIQLDLQGKYQDAYKAYLKADVEFRALQIKRPRWRKQIRGWLVKARFMREHSRNLRPSRYRYRSRSTYARYRSASSLHYKLLAIRAFTGRRERALQKKIIAEYKYLLGRSRYDYRPGLMLASLYNELGRRRDAKRAFDRVPTRYRTRYYVEMAYYHSTRGERDLAFKYIKDGSRYYSHKRLMLQSNLLDRLRTDPRFKKILGDP